MLKMGPLAGKNGSELLERAQNMFDGRGNNEDLLIKKMGCTIAALQAPAMINSAYGYHD